MENFAGHLGPNNGQPVVRGPQFDSHWPTEFAFSGFTYLCSTFLREMNTFCLQYARADVYCIRFWVILAILAAQPEILSMFLVQLPYILRNLFIFVFNRIFY